MPGFSLPGAKLKRSYQGRAGACQTRINTSLTVTCNRPPGRPWNLRHRHARCQGAIDLLPGEDRARFYVERNESAMNTQSNVVSLGDYSRELDQQVEETTTMIHWLTKNNVPPAIAAAVLSEARDDTTRVRAACSIC
jgi:hypothetical protein